MDILTKIRFLLWASVLLLWGVLLHEFLYEGDWKEGRDEAVPLTLSFPEKKEGGPAWNPLRVESHSDLTMVASREAVAVPVPAAVRPGPTPGAPAAKPPPYFPGPPPAERPKKRKPPAPLPGFHSQETPHFLVYSEERAASQKFLLLLEQLHSNLMLDLAIFSPWAEEERVAVYLFRAQESYQRVTGRPSWSGGASSVSHRVVYAYEGEDLTGILAHELCHIYFEAFFDGKRVCPLWLSEGMATLMQVERGLSTPNWLRPNLEMLSRGGGYDLKDLVRIENTTDASERSVRLWYAQSYSLVRFLLRVRWRTQFRKFCLFVREGKTIEEALPSAFGLPITSLKSLEYVWRYDLRTGSLSALAPQRSVELEGR